MANQTPRIFIKSLDHIRNSSSERPVEGHYIAEAFDDVSNAYAQLKSQYTTLAAELAALKKSSK